MNRREFIIASAAGLSRRRAASSLRSRIDRTALLRRHCPVLTSANIKSPLQVGNGAFSFTADVTGLQTFADDYLHGMPLGTLSDWGWHSFPNPCHYQLSDVMQPYDSNGREAPYPDAPQGHGKSAAKIRIHEAYDWLRQNPHWIDLGRLVFILRKANGERAELKDITDIHQRLDLLGGRLESRFEFEGAPVGVTTVCHSSRSMLTVRIRSPLISTRRLGISIGFPYASGSWRFEEGWDSPCRYQTGITQQPHGALFECILDATRYWVQTGWSGQASWRKAGPHRFHLFAPGRNELELIFPSPRTNQYRHSCLSGRSWRLPSITGRSSGRVAGRPTFRPASTRARKNWNAASSFRNT